MSPLVKLCGSDKLGSRGHWHVQVARSWSLTCVLLQALVLGPTAA